MTQCGLDRGENMGEWKCLICEKPVPDYVAKYCCDGQGCACLGKPVEPCVCSQRCHDALVAGIGKPYEQRRVDAGIEVWGTRYVTVNPYTDAPRIYETADAALVDSIRLKREDDNHPMFLLWRVVPGGQGPTLVGYLFRKFGADEFIWKKGT